MAAQQVAVLFPAPWLATWMVDMVFCVLLSCGKIRHCVSCVCTAHHTGLKTRHFWPFLKNFLSHPKHVIWVWVFFVLSNPSICIVCNCYLVHIPARDFMKNQKPLFAFVAISHLTHMMRSSNPVQTMFLNTLCLCATRHPIVVAWSLPAETPIYPFIPPLISLVRRHTLFTDICCPTTHVALYCQNFFNLVNCNVVVFRLCGFCTLAHLSVPGPYLTNFAFFPPYSPPFFTSAHTQMTYTCS